MEIRKIPISWYIILLLIIYILEKNYKISGIFRGLLKKNVKKIPLETSLDLCHKMRDDIDVLIYKFLDNDINDPKLIELTKYSLKGGKRVRPILMLSCFKHSVKNPHPKQVQAITNSMVAMEYIHCSSLIFDDIMDDDNYRRGKEALHYKYNIPLAQLVAINLLTLALKHAVVALKCIDEISDSHINQELIILTEITKKLNNLGMGQYLDVAYADDLKDLGSDIKKLVKGNKIDISTEDIIRKNTSSIFELCYVITWMVIHYQESPEFINKTKDQIMHLAHIFGMIFQIADDYEDYEQDSINNGKNMVMNYPLNKGLDKAHRHFQLYTKQFSNLSKELNLETDEIKEIVLYLKEKEEKYYEYNNKGKC